MELTEHHVRVLAWSKEATKIVPVSDWFKFTISDFAWGTDPSNLSIYPELFTWIMRMEKRTDIIPRYAEMRNIWVEDRDSGHVHAAATVEEAMYRYLKCAYDPTQHCDTWPDWK